jgi:hypothetical protein
MSLKDKVITHTDQDGLYSVIMRREVGMVVLFGPMLFSDSCWTLNHAWGGPALERIQEQKCQHPEVRAEFKKLQKTAERSKIPRECVLFLDCSESVCLQEATLVVQDAFTQDMPMFVIEGHVLASLPNHVGVSLSKILENRIGSKYYKRTREIMALQARYVQHSHSLCLLSDVIPLSRGSE